MCIQTLPKFFCEVQSVGSDTMLCSIIVLLIIKIAIVAGQGQHFPDCWKLAISLQCEAFSKGSLPPPPPPPPHTVQLFPLTTTSGSCDDPMLSLCPPILIWSPIEQWQSIKDKHMCPVCAEGAVHGSLLAPYRWLDGSSEKAQPRKIHDSHGIILLVSRVYRCSRGHEILGHDPSILEKLPQVATGTFPVVA